MQFSTKSVPNVLNEFSLVDYLIYSKLGGEECIFVPFLRNRRNIYTLDKPDVYTVYSKDIMVLGEGIAFSVRSMQKQSVEQFLKLSNSLV